MRVGLNVRRVAVGVVEDSEARGSNNFFSLDSLEDFSPDLVRQIAYGLHAELGQFAGNVLGGVCTDL